MRASALRALRLGHDPRRIDTAVDAAAPLHVPAQNLHLIPARMNDCTNCRWNSRNAISRGPAESSVAALMIDQSMPWSAAENTCNPTVTGRDSTELLMINGHRKLFQ